MWPQAGVTRIRIVWYLHTDTLGISKVRVSLHTFTLRLHPVLRCQCIAHKRDGARKDGATGFTVHDAAAAHCPPHDGLVRGVQCQHDIRSVFALDLRCAGVSVHEEVKCHA